MENIKQMDEKWKNEFTNALIYCENMLEKENLVSNGPPNEISPVSIAIGEEIYKEILYMLADRKIIIDQELIASNEINEDKGYKEVCFEVYFC